MSHKLNQVERAKEHLEREIERKNVLHGQETENIHKHYSQMIETMRQQHQHEIAAAQQKISELSGSLDEIFRSRSWRITAPLRATSSVARSVKRDAVNLILLVRKFVAYSRSIGFYATVLRTVSWIKRKPSESQQLTPSPLLSFEEARRILEGLSYQPLVSVVMPVCNPDEPHLIRALESVSQQYYPHWELCIVDDASTRPYVRKVIEEFAQRFPERVKVRFRGDNGHIVIASNEGLSMTSGEYVAFLDHDDELSPDALLEVVRFLNDHPDADMVYSDEDKIRSDGSYGDPFFKPDWSPELILGEMFTCHLGVYRKEVLDRIGGFREGFEGSQDWDLVLRLSEVTGRIFHIPKVLYHWRMHGGSTALKADHKGYAAEAARKAVEEALKRRGEEAVVEAIAPGRHLVRYQLKGTPLISIIIPTRDLAYDLDKTINSIHHKSSYQKYEIVIVDNNSSEEKTFHTFDKWRKILGSRFKVWECREDFNFSRLVNLGVANSEGDIVLLLNNDMELICPPYWLEDMGAYAQKESIGCVGAVLLYPDNTIQHGGVILGISSDPRTPGVAGHAFKHLPADHPGYFDRLRIVSNWSAVTGACLMVRRSLWDEVQGFDESLAVAFNDVDFCLKLLTKGYRHVLLPHVRLYHYESKSRGYEDTVDKQIRFKGEIDIMRKRWGFILDNDPYYNPQLPKNREDFGLT
jgi:GT2 family glycosyltransferase